MRAAHRIWLTGFILLTACSRHGGDGTFHPGASEIYFGSVVQADAAHPAPFNAVGIISGHGLMPNCTGSLIAPDQVVTAAHCVAAGSARFIRFAGPSLAAPIEIAVARTVVHPGYRLRAAPDHPMLYPSFDLAWIQLAAPAPSPFRAVEILPDEEDPAAGGAVVVAGYGTTEHTLAGQPTDGVLREAQVKMLAVRRDPYFHNVVEFDQVTQGVCSGDSGGPAYSERDGKWYLIGATVGTQLQRAGCGQGHVYFTYLPGYREWLQKVPETPTVPVDPTLDDLWGSQPLESGSLSDLCRQWGVSRSTWLQVRTALAFVGALNCDEAEERAAASSNYALSHRLIGLQDSPEPLSDADAQVPSQILASLTGLKELTILGMNTDPRLGIDLQRVAPELTALEKLSVSSLGTGPSLLHFEALPQFQQLRDLTFSDAPLPETSPVTELPSLKILRLPRTGLSSLEWLRDSASKETLEEIDLSNNSITDLSPLSEFTHLRKITLKHNSIPFTASACPVAGVTCTF